MNLFINIRPKSYVFGNKILTDHHFISYSLECTSSSLQCALIPCLRNYITSHTVCVAKPRSVENRASFSKNKCFIWTQSRLQLCSTSKCICCCKLAIFYEQFPKKMLTLKRKTEEDEKKIKYYARKLAQLTASSHTLTVAFCLFHPLNQLQWSIEWWTFF